MSVTSADVAKAAGVSRATVSYVLNNVPGRTLSPETRANVLRVAAELDYRPNAMAKSLKRGRSSIVLLPLRGLAPNHVLSDLFIACTEALAPLGLSLVLDLSDHDDAVVQADAWADLAPAAVLDLVLHHDDPAIAHLQARGTLVLSALRGDEASWQSTGDQFAIAQRLVQVAFLTERGCRRIRWVVPPALPDAVDPRTADHLLGVLRDAAAAGGAELELERIALDDVADAVAGWTALPDAVAAHNDTYAIAVITALARRGVRVPEDVAVIGADDDPVGRAVTPALTTVGGDFRQFATSAAEAVVAGIERRDIPELVVPVPVLVRRDSA